MSFRPALHVPREQQYFDIFATAPGNDGLRLEYGQNGTLSIVIAAHNPAGLLGYVLANDVKPNHWHNFHMTVDRFGFLAADLDGREHIGVAAPEIAFAINEITIGGGYSARRLFVGKISHGMVNYGIYDRNPFADEEAVDLEAFGVLVALSALYFFIGPESWSTLRWSWTGRPPWKNAPEAIPLADWASRERDTRGYSLRYIWPLPDDSHAILDFEGNELTHRALGLLARNITSFPQAELGKAYSLELGDGIKARVLFGGRNTPTKRAFKKLVEYIRDLASFAGV